MMNWYIIVILSDGEPIVFDYSFSFLCDLCGYYREKFIVAYTTIRSISENVALETGEFFLRDEIRNGKAGFIWFDWKLYDKFESISDLRNEKTYRKKIESLAAVEKNNGNKTHAAKEIGIGRVSLWKRNRKKEENVFKLKAEA